MSKHINVNPDHYKVAGRERPGNAVAKAKVRAAMDKEELARWEKRQRSNKPVRGRGAEKTKGRS